MGNLTVSADKRVSLGKIKIPAYPGIEKFELKDGSFCCRIWDKHIAEFKLELKNAQLGSWQAGYSKYGSQLLVPTIKEKELLYNITIVRPSAHMFYVTISSEKSTTFARCKNYDDINAVLEPIIKKLK